MRSMVFIYRVSFSCLYPSFMYLNYTHCFCSCFSVLTPYYKEDVLYSEEELNKENEDGISILFYLQKIYPGTFLILDKTSNFYFDSKFKFTKLILRELRRVDQLFGSRK